MVVTVERAKLLSYGRWVRTATHAPWSLVMFHSMGGRMLMQDGQGLSILWNVRCLLYHNERIMIMVTANHLHSVVGSTFAIANIKYPLNDIIDLHGLMLLRLLEQRPCCSPQCRVCRGLCCCRPVFASCTRLSGQQRAAPEQCCTSNAQNHS